MQRMIGRVAFAAACGLAGCASQSQAQDSHPVSPAGPSSGQATWESRVESAQSSRWDGQLPTAALSRHTLLQSANAVFAVYLFHDRDAPPEPMEFVIRRENSLGVTWASTLSCPGLNDLIAEMETVSSPAVDIVGVGNPVIITPEVDPILYRLWVTTANWTDARASDLAFTGSEESPLGAWAQRFTALVEPCLSEEEP